MEAGRGPLLAGGQIGATAAGTIPPREARKALLAALFADAGASDGDGPAAIVQRAADRARAQGLVVLVLGLQPEEEASALAQVHTAIARQGVRDGRAANPTLLLSAGPVRVQGAEAGAAAWLLTLALALDGHPAIYACAWGPAQPGAGSPWCGFLAPDTMLRARAQKIEPVAALRTGAGDAFFAALGDAIAPAAAGAPARDVVRAILLD